MNNVEVLKESELKSLETQINNGNMSISIDDTKGNFTSNNVEGALEELVVGVNKVAGLGRGLIAEAIGEPASERDHYHVLAKHIDTHTERFRTVVTDSGVVTSNGTDKMKNLIDKTSEGFTGLKSQKQALETEISQGKSSISTAVGAPLTSNESFSSQASKIDTITNTLKTNLANRGVNVSEGDKLSGLVSAVELIKRGQGNAIAGDVLSGKTFTNDSGELIIGSIDVKVGTVQTTATYESDGGISVTPPTGFYKGTKIKITPEELRRIETDLKASNINKGTNIFGVLGTLTPGKKSASGSASASSGSISVSGLDFRPSTVVATGTHGRYTIVTVSFNGAGYAFDYASESDSAVKTTYVSTNSSGFSLSFSLPANGYISWAAYE